VDTGLREAEGVEVMGVEEGMVVEIATGMILGTGAAVEDSRIVVTKDTRGVIKQGTQLGV